MTRTATTLATLSEARRQPRTHVFVSASLYWDASSLRINIRNMSSTGALIEAADIPDVGTEVVLRRGSLEAKAQIAWTVKGKAGVAFHTSIRVADWIARPVNIGQNHIDSIVSAVKASREAANCGRLAEAPKSCPATTELTKLRSELGLLGDSLIGNAEVVANHPEVQLLDVALQRIDRVIKQLGKR